LLVAVVGAMVAGCGGSSAPPAALERKLLRPQQVGAGYRHGKLRRLPHGSRLLYGLCSPIYASDRLRGESLQLIYTLAHPSGQRLGVMNELSLYRDNGAQQALHELRASIEACSTPALGPTSIEKQVQFLSDERLLPGYVAVEVLRTVPLTKRSYEEVWIYQAQGDTLSAILAIAHDRTPTPELVPFALRAAEASARNLTAKAG